MRRNVFGIGMSGLAQPKIAIAVSVTFVDNGETAISASAEEIEKWENWTHF